MYYVIKSKFKNSRDSKYLKALFDNCGGNVVPVRYEKHKMENYTTDHCLKFFFSFVILLNVTIHDWCKY